METLNVEKSPCMSEIEVHYKNKISVSQRRKVKTSFEIERLFREIFNPNKLDHIEEMVVLCLSRGLQVLGWAKVSTGGLTQTLCDARVIFQIALVANASSIVLCHNHPSGDLKPSPHDIERTKEIKKARELLQIQLIDHIIITSDSYYSFADEKML